jgi:hypothetical protein
MSFLYRTVLIALVAVALTAPASAQQNVTQSDIQRLQDNVFLAERDITQMRGRDTTRASQLTAELDELRDEVVYLKVKLRKERSLARSEYADVRDRIENLRTRARGDATGAYSTPGSAQSGSAVGGRTQAGTRGAGTTGTGAYTIPSGTEIDVRLQNSLNSGTAQVEDRFEATTLVDLNVNGRVVIPAGSVVRGVVTAVEPGTRTNRTSRMTVSFDQVTVSGRSYPFRGTVTEAIEGSGIRGEATRAGAGAGVGAIIGAVIGGVKGAVLGAVIGGGGTIAATEGKEVDLPQGTVLRLRVDEPLDIGSAR